MPPSIWPSTGLRVDRLADVLRGADPDDARRGRARRRPRRRPASRSAGERDVRALAGDLAGLRVERRRRAGGGRSRSTSTSLAAARRALRRAPARQASRTAPAAIHVMPRGRRRAGRVDRRGRRRREPRRRRCRARCARPAGSRSSTPWPTSAAAQCTSAASRSPATTEPHARGAVVVEALGEADVLEADREADAAADALAVRRVAGAAGQAERVARQLLGRRRHRARPRARITSATGSEPVDHAARSAACRPGSSAFSSRSSTGSMLERGGELVHLRLVREAASARRRSRASRRTAGCSCRRT